MMISNRTMDYGILNLRKKINISSVQRFWWKLQCKNIPSTYFIVLRQGNFWLIFFYPKRFKNVCLHKGEHFLPQDYKNISQLTVEKNNKITQ